MDFTVYAKFRPFIKSDKTKEKKCSAAFHPGNEKVMVKVILFLKIKFGVKNPKEYNFQKVFNNKCTQEDVFNEINIPIVTS
jgi:hypothetical protein